MANNQFKADLKHINALLHTEDDPAVKRALCILYGLIKSLSQEGV